MEIILCFEKYYTLFGNLAVATLNTLLLQLIPGDLLSACPHRQFHTLPSCTIKLLTLLKCVPSREAICTIFMMVFGMTRLGCEPATYRMRRTR